MNRLLFSALVSMAFAVGDALEAAPGFSISTTFEGPSALQLNWPAKSGQVYEVQALENLDQPWAAIDPPDLPTIATTDSLSVELAAVDPRKFFQVLEQSSPYDPAWQGTEPLRVISFSYDNQKDDVQNGADLKAAILALIPGDRLEIGPGTYSINGFTQIDLQGTSSNPIWIVADEGASVVITRPDANQNIINVGVNSQSRYLCFRDIEFVGGSHGVRLYDCNNVWIDRCRVRDTGDVGLSANARDTSKLHITRNEIWNTGGTGEGMYLGGNNGSVIMSESIIALNYVHDTDNGTSQGDGIEVKQGSWGNLIVANTVHDANYPCIIVYGTAGQPVNIVENNICYGSNDNTMQIQGECIVRNNLVMAAAGNAFASQPHQGQPTKMTVVHNTFINTGTAARMNNWDEGTEMVFANNACYSQSGAALNAVNGTTGVTFAGNVNYGSVNAGASGFTAGTGLEDFEDISWDATKRNAKPSANSVLLGTGDTVHATEVDLSFFTRTAPHTTGCQQR